MWNDVVVHPTIPCRVYWYTRKHFYESSDCGETFTEQNFIIAPVRAEQHETPSFCIATLYPNPYQRSSGSEISLVVESDAGQNISIGVFDILGRQVLTMKNVVTLQSEITIPLDVATLRSGVYAVKVSNETTTITKTFLVR